jgi:polyisoprenoid-binding protein YceI
MIEIRKSLAQPDANKEKPMYARTAAVVLATLVAGTAYAAPENYTIDSTHTFPSFEVSHLGFSTQRGRFNKTTGSIVLDRAAKKATVDISIDANSISTGLEKLEAHLRAEDFFDTAKHPAISFKSTGATFNGDKLASVSGNLTMRGVTKPVTLNVTAFHCGFNPAYKKDACGADAVTTIKRSDFGINYALPAVSDEVKLLIQVEAHKN